MPVLLANVRFDVYRNQYNATSGQTGSVVPYLQHVHGHIGPVPAIALVPLPESALYCTYLLKVESGTDIAIGDQVTNIVLAHDITAAWPGDLAGNTANGLAAYWVRYTYETGPLLLPVRQVYLDRVEAGGTTHQ